MWHFVSTLLHFNIFVRLLSFILSLSLSPPSIIFKSPAILVGEVNNLIVLWFSSFGTVLAASVPCVCVSCVSGIHNLTWFEYSMVGRIYFLIYLIALQWLSNIAILFIFLRIDSYLWRWLFMLWHNWSFFLGFDSLFTYILIHLMHALFKVYLVWLLRARKVVQRNC